MEMSQLLSRTPAGSPCLRQGRGSSISMRSLCFRQCRGSSISMLPVRKQVTSIRLISASASAPASPSPYLFLSPFPEKETCFGVYDPRKGDIVNESVEIPDKSMWKSSYMGSSRGWCALYNSGDGLIHLTNVFNPSSSSPKFISLPPLVNRIIKDGDPGMQNVALSCPPDKDGCVMAVKFRGDDYRGVEFGNYGISLSLCRLGDPEWTHIETPSDFLDSYVMYSERDQMFYLNTPPSCQYSGPSRCDLPNPYYPPVAYRHLLPLRGMESMRQELDQLPLEVYMVESPSGEIFTVLEYLGRYFRAPFPTKRIMVFRRDMENGAEIYTEDIGDLCILVGENGAFCLPASRYPGLTPNSVYSAQTSVVCVYHLASGALHDLEGDFDDLSFWLEPLEQ